MNKACIDIGSNSILLLIKDLSSGNVLEDVAKMVGLGKGIDQTGEFDPLKMDLALSVLTEFKDLIDQHQCNEVLVTATEASRVAKNAKDFFHKIKEELNFDIQIITGEGEAFYTSKGVLSSLENKEEDIIIMDIGGGSTELIRVKPEPFEIEKSISLKVGAVRAFEWIEDGSFEQKIQALLTTSIDKFKTKTLICTAGTLTSVGAMSLGLKEFDEKLVDGHKLTVLEFENFTAQISSLSTDEILVKYPFLGTRSLNILPGMRASLSIFKYLGVCDLIISTKGLRYGIMSSKQIENNFLAQV